MLQKIIFILALIALVTYGQKCLHDKFVTRTPRTCSGTTGTTACPTALARTGKVPAAFRLAFDITGLKTYSGVTASSTTLFTQATNVIARYFKDLLQVYQETGNNKYVKTGTTTNTNLACNGYAYPIAATTTGIAGADLNIYVLFETAAATGDNLITDPVGVACSWLPKLTFHPDRPNFGVIRYAYAESQIVLKLPTASPSYYRRIFNTLLHQTFHILGFSLSELTYWHKFTPSGAVEYYTAADMWEVETENTDTVGNHNFLTTPAVKEATRQQFSRSWSDYFNGEWVGAKLENQGHQNANYLTATNFGSHWEFTTTFGEIMTAGGYIGYQAPALVSQLTLAALRDSGYYAFVNQAMADIIPWGMNWGSSFVYNECNTQGLPLGTFGFGLCDFYNFGAAHSYISTDDLDEGDTTTLNYDFIDTGCIMALTTPAASCINDVDVIPGRKFKFITFEQFGVNSRCFLSNIVARNVGGQYNDFDVSYPDEYFRCYNTWGDHAYINWQGDETPQIGYSFSIGKKLFTVQLGKGHNWYFDYDFPQYQILDSKKNILASYEPDGPEDFYLSADAYDLNLEVLSGFFQPDDMGMMDHIIMAVGTECPNFCSLNGYCQHGTAGCVCLDGFIGVDCSITATAKQPSCTSAKQVLDYYSGNCLPTCPIGRYAIGTTACGRCGFGCDKCTSYYVCTVCHGGAFLQGGYCVPECGVGYYDIKGIQGQCFPCPQLTGGNCQTCFLNGDDACLKCFFQDTTTCVPAPPA